MKRLTKIVGVRLGEKHLEFLEDVSQVSARTWYFHGYKPSEILRQALDDFMNGDGKKRAEFLQEVVKQKKEIRNFCSTSAAAAVKRSAGPAVKQSIGRKNVKRSAGRMSNNAGKVQQ